uniref:Uncharacterized protein n=1 Tax=Anopheles dirus TaxID=7168 RepID=A0A182MZ63_9DIPT
MRGCGETDPGRKPGSGEEEVPDDRYPPAATAADEARYDVDGSGDSCPGSGVLPAKLTVGPLVPAGGSVSRLPADELVPAFPPGPCCTVTDPLPVIGTVRVVDVAPGTVAVAAPDFVGELSGVGPMIMRDVSISRLEGSVGAAVALLELVLVPYAEVCSSRPAGFCWCTDVRCRRSLLSLRWWLVVPLLGECDCSSSTSSPVRSITCVSDAGRAPACLRCESASSPSDILTIAASSRRAPSIFFSSKGTIRFDDTFCSFCRNSDVVAICRSASTPSYVFVLTIDLGYI